VRTHSNLESRHVQLAALLEMGQHTALLANGGAAVLDAGGSNPASV
jgi:hypothetical protein